VAIRPDKTPSNVGRTAMERKNGAIVVDIQGDFTQWKHGSLAVPGTGKGYVKRAERDAIRLKDMGFVVFGSQDWHPPDHMSFAVNHVGRRPMDTITVNGRTQVLWPEHCVQGTENARVLIDNKLLLAIVRKGQDPRFDSYSAFRDDGGGETEMENVLIANHVGPLVIFGLATDYCVRATALDALLYGHEVVIVKTLCRGIEPASSVAAFERLEERGARIVDKIEDI
jgi:nicotinamidase/pyrazinamidase